MHMLLTVLTVLLCLSSLLATAWYAFHPASRLGLLGGLCFSMALVGGLILGWEGKALLFFALLLLTVSQFGGKGARP